MPITDHAYYLNHAFDRPEHIAALARETIPESLKFDVLVGRGLSGALVVPIIAGAFGKRFGIVRKEDPDDNHSGRTFEGTLGGRWLFVDDLISSGETFRAVHEAVAVRAGESRFRTQCAGAYLYNYPRYMDPDSLRCYR